MRRLMIVLALAMLLGSAGYAYRVKYDSIILAEQVAKLKSRIAREKDAIGVLKAEWQYINRPDRVQALADAHTDLQALQVQQIVRWSDVPQQQPQIDSIGQKMEMLGLVENTATPAPARIVEARTPSQRKQP
jgi:hypothetical protein